MKQKAIISIFGMFALLAIGSSAFLYRDENNHTYTKTFIVQKANFSSSGITNILVYNLGTN